MDAAGLARSNSQIRIRVNPSQAEPFWIDESPSPNGKTNGKNGPDSFFKSYIMKFFNRFLHGTTPVMNVHGEESSAQPGLCDSIMCLITVNRYFLYNICFLVIISCFRYYFMKKKLGLSISTLLSIILTYI